MLSDALPDTNEHLAVEMTGVIQNYNKKVPKSALVFSDWQLKRADQVFLHGDSGSGKSTVLNMLSGILQPQQGSIKLFGTDIVALSNRSRDAFRANNIGVVFQQFNLVPYLSVYQNIKLATYFGNAGKDDKGNTKQHVERLLEQLKLDQSLMHRKVSELSVGQRQRVAILRAFANSPSLLLVDEPTSALDASARNAFMNMLLSTSVSQGTTMVFVSHDEALKEHFQHHVSMASLLTNNITGHEQKGHQHVG